MRGTAASFSSVILMVAGICAYESTAPEAPKAATASAEESTEALLAKLGKATARDERDGIVTILLGRDKPALEKLRKYADQRVSGLEKQYTDFLNANLRTLYKQKLLALTDEQITSIQKTRRFWKPYLLAAMHDDNFMHDYLEPAKEVSKLLLLDAEKDLDERGKGLRAELLEAGGYQTKCNLALGGDPDPTKGKKSPTGIAIPPLSSPPTFQSYVSYLEKTLVLANTVAPEGARKVLLKNLEISREIDIEEADYVLYANEIRMCMGSQAWSVDPLLCAATRDHSTDRKNGKASAHMSTIPGKEGFVDRAKRFGTGASSEGAGGGRNGRNYLEGLSHEGDGHTGPLYGIHRNVIGVGRHEGVYTSNYRTDHTLDHPCPVTTGEQFMPPGLTGKEFTNPTAASVFTCLKNSQYGVAQTIIAKALETPTDGKTDSKPANNAALALTGFGGSGGSGVGKSRELDGLERVLLKFFQAEVQAQSSGCLDELAAFKESGDVYELKCRTENAQKNFQGIQAVTEGLAPYLEFLKTKEVAAEIQAGAVYNLVATGEATDEVRLQNMKTFCQKYKESIYTKAAELYLSKPTDKNPFSFFLDKKSILNQFSYPPALKRAKK